MCWAVELSPLLLRNNSNVQLLQYLPFLLQGVVLQMRLHTCAILHKGRRFQLSLLNEALLFVQTGKFLLGTGASGVDLGLLGLEVGQVNRLAQIRRLPPLQVFVALGKLTAVV